MLLVRSYLNDDINYNEYYNTAEKCFPIFPLCLEPFNNIHCKYRRLLPHWHSAPANRSALCQCAATSMDNADDMNEQLFRYNSS